MKNNLTEENKTMKRKYFVPEMSVVSIEMTDIITTSTGEFDGEWVSTGGKKSAIALPIVPN